MRHISRLENARRHIRLTPWASAVPLDERVSVGILQEVELELIGLIDTGSLASLKLAVVVNGVDVAHSGMSPWRVVHVLCINIMQSTRNEHECLCTYLLRIFLKQ